MAESLPIRAALQAVHRRRAAGVHPLLQHAQIGAEHDVAAERGSAASVGKGVAQVLKLGKMAAALALKFLYLHDGKYRPIEVYLPKVRRLCRAAGFGFRRLIKDQASQVIDLRP